MCLEGVTKTLVQCDFDGTITEEDVSFMLLDAFADRDPRRWRQLYIIRPTDISYLPISRGVAKLGQVGRTDQQGGEKRW